LRAEVEAAVGRFSFARYFYHTGKNAAAARNFCAKSASGDILVTVDDDVYVEPESIRRLYDYYEALEDKNAIVSGSVKFGDLFSTPVVMRLIGYGRPANKNEGFDFVVSAFLLYPRFVVESCSMRFLSERVCTGCFVSSFSGLPQAPKNTSTGAGKHWLT
jgi:glycosyltransferase involved in cell wall biosynthesis